MTTILLALALCADPTPPGGVLPLSADGKPLNLDFETGTLKDWTADGEAFKDQPIRGDAVFLRRSDMRSLHQGQYWIGGYERFGDKPKGTLTSLPFKVTHPWASFLIGGGSYEKETCVEVVDVAAKAVIFRASGIESESLGKVAVDLTKHQGKDIQIRIVDGHTGHWGHVNFDDFRFHSSKPQAGERVVIKPDEYRFSGQNPEDAAKNMTVPPGFSVKLFAGEPDLHQPIGFCTDDRGRLWVVEAFCYPKRKPFPGPLLPEPERKSGDKILIFEDTDGDGKFDKRTVFIEGLNLVSGIEYGFGGIWVGAAPYLMFIPINEGDKPGEPQILLDGWGMEDTHETLNSFIWGPDGWLYGCHGVFTHSRVGKPGTPNKDRIPINAGIWRYHPTKHVFEVFAHGTSNPWGLDYNQHGDFFAEACVIPHLWHIVQGGRYERQAGQHFNPYTYVEIPTIAKHRHYVGATPHGGNNRSDSVGGGHAHSGLLCYQGGLWPKEYHGKLFMGNIHGHRINVDVVTPKGSGYEGDRNPDFLLSNDKTCLIVGIQASPDGNVYFCDWSDKQVCHRNEVEIWDRTNGRIFKIVHKDTKPVVGLDLQKLSDDELMKHLANENQWYVRHARRILQERGKAESTETHEIASKSSTPRDRRLLASKLTTMPVSTRIDHLPGLLSFAEDANDPLLPFLYWYALEPIAAEMPERALDIARNAKIPTLLPLTARRIGAIGTGNVFELLIKQLTADTQTENNLAYLRGLQEGLKGRKVELSASWPAVYAVLSKSENAEVRKVALAVAVAFRDPNAIQTMFDIAADTKAGPGERQNALAAVLDAGHNRTAGLLKQLIAEPAMRSAAIRGMARIQDDGVPAAILAVYASLTPTEKRDAVNTLASRSSYAKELLDAVGAKKLPATDIPAETVRQLRNLSDKTVVAKIAEVWGTVRDTPADRKRLMSDWTKKLNAPYQGAADLSHGRAVFAKVCQQCHTLYGVGSKVGPEITGSNRADLNYLIENIFDPSAVIPKEYAATKLDLADGRVVTGLIKEDNGTILTVATATETLTIPVKDVEKRSPSELSMMPDDLTKPLTDLDVRNLVAYLRHNQQVPMKATAENAKEFFNGKDLKGWDMDETAKELNVWSVENGEIVGKSAKGLKKNTFLTSQLEVTDFKLSLKIKLTPNTENSGVQIRSVRIEGGEMRGPQCDAGKGWWGKLYEESGRGLLWKEDREKYVKENDWNDYVIEAKGSTVKTWLNGQACVNLTDEKLSKKGLIGLQVHSGGPIEVRFKDLKLEVLNP
jgi:putative membrane-bound dehydrogenase-like protein